MILDAIGRKPNLWNVALLCIGMALGSGCAATPSPKPQSSVREQILLAEVLRLQKELVFLEQKLASEEAIRKQTEQSLPSPTVTTSGSGALAFEPVLPLQALPELTTTGASTSDTCQDVNRQLRDVSRAIARVVDRLELSPEAKRELLQSVRPMRALDLENPWVAAK